MKGAGEDNRTWAGSLPGGSFSTLGPLFRKIQSRTLCVCGWYLAALYVMLPVADAAARTMMIGNVYSFGFSLLGMAAVLLTVTWTGKWLLDREHCPSRAWNITDMALLLMLLWSGVCTLMSPSPMNAFLGNIHRQEGFVTYLIYGSVYFCCRRSCTHPRAHRLLWLLCLTGTFLSGWSLIFASPLGELAKTRYGHGTVWYYSVGAIFANPNHFAYFLSMSIMAAAGLFVMEASGKSRLLAGMAYLIQVLMLKVNGTLGGYLAVCVALVFMWILLRARKNGGQLRILALAAVLAVSFLAFRNTGYDVVADVQTAMDSLEQGSTADSSGAARLLMWKQALEYIAQRPLFGFGPDGGDMLAFEVAGVANDRPHNEYLQYALFFGIPGALFYLTALISLFIRCIMRLRKLSATALILGGMVFAYCASAFVGNSMYYTTVYFVIILALLMNESVKDE